MSTFTAIAVLMVLAIMGLFLNIFVERTLKDRSEEVLTGVVRGVPVSVEARRVVLNTLWMRAASGQVAIHVVLSIMWMLLGKTASSDEVRTMAYLIAFVGWTGVLFSIIQGVSWFRLLQSALRQAESHRAPFSADT